MVKEQYILVKHYCRQTKTEDRFIYELHEHGLIHCQEIESERYILADDISEIDRISRLHYDLGINLEGIEALNHMLERMQQLERELNILQSRLNLYE